MNNFKVSSSSKSVGPSQSQVPSVIPRYIPRKRMTRPRPVRSTGEVASVTVAPVRGVVLSEYVQIAQKTAKEQMADQLAQVKRAQMVLRNHLNKLCAKTFAQVASVNATPTMEFTQFVDWSTEEARADYEKARLAARKQRESCYLLACAMRDRACKPKRVRKRHVKVNFDRCEVVQGVPVLPLACGNRKRVEHPKEAPKCVATSTKQRKIRSRSTPDLSNILIGPLPLWVEVPKRRVKSFNCLCLCRDCPERRYIPLIHQVVKTTLLKVRSMPSPQMDNEGVKGEPPNVVDHRSNTVITEFGNVDRGVGPPSGRNQVNMSVPTEIRGDISERWMPLTNFKWSTSDEVGAVLHMSVQPLELIKANLDNPALQELLTHRYVRFGMKFKFQLNSNQFQTGQCISAFTYGEKSAIYDAFGCQIQRAHCFVQAGKSNDGEIEVEYQFPRSVLRTNADGLRMGSLTVMVMNQLRATGSVPSNCNITILGCLTNPEFYGSMSRKLVRKDIDSKPEEFEFFSPQMDTIGNLIGAGTTILNAFHKDNNRDKPPCPQQPGSFIPQATTSMCYMKNVQEPVNVLRADPRGQKPSLSTVDEMDIKYITRKWGYLATKKWNMSDDRGKQLYFSNVHPMIKKTSWPTQTVKGVDLALYQLTPIAEIADLHSFYRGDLEYKFQFIANGYYTGKIIIGVIPGGIADKPTIEDLMASPYQVFDLSTGSEVVFRAPYYADKAWTSNRMFDEGYRGDKPSQIYMMVQVPLTAIDSVPTNIDFNIFVRGADNFEVAIPRAPTYVPAVSKAYIPPQNEYLTPYNKEIKLYTTWERNIVWNDSAYSVTAYVQNITDGWAGYTGAQADSYYRLVGTHQGKKLRIPVVKDQQGGILYPSYGVPDPDLKNSNAQGLVLCGSADNAVAYVQGLMQGIDRKILRKSYSLRYYTDSGWSEVGTIDPKTKQTKWAPAENGDDYPIWERVQVDTPKPQVGEVVVSLEKPVISTSFGQKTFGENITSLKDLCRRWYPYSSVSGKSCGSRKPIDCPYFAKIPIHYLVKPQKTTSDGFWNRWREGPHTKIGSAYYLGEGGVRFRIMPVGKLPSGSKIMVSHRHDEDSSWATEPTMGSKTKNALDLANSAYASFIQGMDVNQIMTIEIPYNSSNESLVLGTSNKSEYYSLGMLYLWVSTPEPVDVDLEIYYSFADDTVLRVFQGFPISFNLADITDEPSPQMDGDPNIGLNDLGSFMSGNSASFAAGVFGAAGVKAMFDISNSAKKVADSCSKVDSVVDTAQNIADSIYRHVKITPEEAKEKINDLPGLLGLVSKRNIPRLLTALSPLVYVALNPTKTTIMFALFQSYVQLFGVEISPFASFIELMDRLWNYVFPTKQQQQEGEPNSGTTPIEEFVELILKTLVSVLSVKIAWSSQDIAGISKAVFTAAAGYRLVDSSTDFIVKCISMVKEGFDWISRKMGLNRVDYAFFSGHKDTRLRDWLVFASVVLSPQYKKYCFSSQLWSSRVFCLSIMGRAINLAIANGSVKLPPTLITELRSKIKSIQELEQDLIQMKVYAPVRYEPFCLWFCGSPGTSKTTLGTEASLMLSSEFGKKRGVYPRTGGQKYFDAYQDQDVIFIDDFLTMGPKDDPETYAQFLQMKSCVQFNPPYSRVEDKTRFINFDNLVVTSNLTHFSGMEGLKNAKAFDRRRDLLIYLRLVVPKGMENRRVTDCFTPEQLEAMEHVQAWAPADVMTPSTKALKQPHEEIIPKDATMKEAIMDCIREHATRYHAMQSRVYSKRCEDYNRYMNNIEAGNDINETMKKAVNELKSMIKGWDDGDVNNSPIFDEFENLFASWMNSARQEAGSPNIDSDAMSLDYFIKYIRDDRNVEVKTERTIQEELSKLYQTRKEIPTHDGLPNGHRAHYDDTVYLREPLDRDSDPYFYVNEYHCLHDYDYEHYNIEGMYYYNLFVPPSDVPQSAPIGPCIKIDDKGTPIIMEHCKFQKYARTMVKREWPVLRKTIMKGMRQPGGCAELVKNIPHHWLDHIIVQAELEMAYKQYKGQFAERDPEYSFFPGQDDPNYQRDRQQRQEHVESFLEKCRRWFNEGVAWLWDIPLNLKHFYDTTSKVDYSNYLENFIVYGTMFLMAVWVAKAIIATFRCLAGPNIHPSGDTKTVKVKGNPRDRALQLLATNNAFTEHPPEMDGIYKKLDKNTVFLTCEVNGKLIKMRCLGLRGHELLVLRHYIEYCEHHHVERLTIASVTVGCAFEVKLEDLKFSWTEEGYGVCYLPSSYPRQFSDVTKYMPKENSHLYPSRMVIYENHGKTATQYEVETRPLEEDVKIRAEDGMAPWVITRGFSYNWAGKGKCGSLLICPQLQHPLVGIHTAGYREARGFAERLNRETFCMSPELDYVDLESSGVPEFELDGQYSVEGRLEPNMRVFNQQQTRIIPSQIAGTFPVHTEPAPLQKDDPRLVGDEVDPFKLGVSKRCMPTKHFSESLVMECAEDLNDLLVENCKPLRTVGPMTIKQAVEGHPIEGYVPMEMSTSEGFPWIKLRPGGAKGKRWLFDLRETEDGWKLERINADLKYVLDRKSEQRKSGLVPKSYFSACLKDARIPKEKCSIPGKTRIFEICPVELTIAMRQYFMDFTAAYKKNRFECENTIGINPDGPEWSRLAEELKRFDYILTADFSGYGPRLDKMLVEMAFRIQTDWYVANGDDNPDNILTRLALAKEILYSPHIAGDLIFGTSSGHPSGQPQTVEINSLCNSLLIRLAFLLLARRHAPQFASLRYFHLFLKLFHNGDDLIVGVAKEIIGWFNNISLIELFAEYGIKMTDASKTGKEVPHLPLEESTYLKRGFQRHPFRDEWLAPLDEKSIKDTANWCWKSTNYQGASLVNSEMCCRLAYTRGPEFYESVARDLKRAWREQGVRFQYPSWLDLDKTVWDGIENGGFSF